MLPQFKKEFLNTIKSDKMIEIVEILDRANDFGLTTEVVVTALKEMQNNPESSPLLSLQIAAQDWDL
jgi:hypothetical protein|tara:strand:- start:9708 stop:9908 length:201 start_codon:yes stop_codon:yes gene_type:complete